MSTHCIGVAGYMGAGKTECSRILAREGYRVIDGDLLAKDIMREHEEVRRQVALAFGAAVADECGINFSVLGKIVFSDSDKLLRLNAIVHPVVLSRLRRMVNDLRGGANVVIDAALIPLWSIEDWFDLRLWVHCSPELRLHRLVKKRPELTKREIEKRMRMQEKHLSPPSRETWVYVENSRDPAWFQRKLMQIMDPVVPGTADDRRYKSQ